MFTEHDDEADLEPIIAPLLAAGRGAALPLPPSHVGVELKRSIDFAWDDLPQHIITVGERHARFAVVHAAHPRPAVRADRARARGAALTASAPRATVELMEVLEGRALDRRLDAVLEFLGAFFMGQSPVHLAAAEIARRLEEAGIDYAIAGALSLGVHGFVRATEDVDLIVTRAGLERFKERWLGRGYVNLRAGGKAVRDTIHGVKIDFLITGDFPGDGKPKPIAIPEPGPSSIAGEKYRVISLRTLIELKLASGMTAPHRMQDLTDVLRLISLNRIPADYVEQLDPYVRDKFRELWHIAQQADDE